MGFKICIKILNINMHLTSYTFNKPKSTQKLALGFQSMGKKSNINTHSISKFKSKEPKKPKSKRKKRTCLEDGHRDIMTKTTNAIKSTNTMCSKGKRGGRENNNNRGVGVG